MACAADTALPNAEINTTARYRIAPPCHKSNGEKNVSHQATARAGQAVNDVIHDAVCPSTNDPTSKVPPFLYKEAERAGEYREGRWRGAGTEEGGVQKC